MKRPTKQYVSTGCLYALSSNNVTEERESPMSGAVLPRLSTDDTTAQLPANPNHLLSSKEQQRLSEGLAKLAELRRDAETDSASLRLA